MVACVPGLWDRIGRTGKAVLLLGVGLAGGAAAVAVAAIPDSNGAIHACYSVTNGEPVTSTANLRIIDPGAGQTCSTSLAGAPAPEKQIDWNQSGPAGPTGPQGPAGQNGENGQNGAPGQTGQTGAPGRSATFAAGNTFTLSGGQVITVGQSTGVTIQQPPLKHVVGGASLNGGGTGLTFGDLLAVSFATGGGTSSSGSGGGAGKVKFHDISITKYVDKSSAKLALFCANGKHIPKATITLRKAGKTYLTYTLTDVLISSYQTGGFAQDKQPTETLSLNFTKIEIQYAK